MSVQEPEVEFMENNGTTVAVIDGEAYNLSDGEVAIHETDNSLVLITENDSYHAELDENGWVILSEDTPDSVLTKLDEEDLRYADAEVTGFPAELDVGFRSDEAVYSSAWQNEVLRPSMDVAEEIDGAIREVKLTLEIEEDGSITVTDLGVWPNHTDVEIDI